MRRYIKNDDGDDDDDDDELVSHLQPTTQRS